MKHSIQHIFYALAGIALLAGCEAEFDNPVGDTSSYSSGTADFSTFIVVGDSLTAGYADSALYRTGQQNSYGATLAQQFALVGGGVFNQPLMPVGATGSLTLAANPLPVSDRLVLAPTGDPTSPAAPSAITPTQSTEIGVPLTGAFNNMGVPAAKSFHLTLANFGDPAGVPGGTANPFFVRFASSATTSMIADSAAQVPSFFVLWIGNNDILLYATAGGPGTSAPPYGIGGTDVTDPAVFTPTYNGLVAALKTVNNKGVLVNIPDVSTIPYFTTVPYNAIPMTGQDVIDANNGFALYNGGVTASIGFNGLTAAEAAQRQINFVDGQNAIVILDDNLTDLTGVPGTGGALINMRQATANDFIVLPTSTKLGTDAGGGLLWGISAPLDDADVLTETEVGFVETARTAYNATILAAANVDDDLLHFDASAMLTELNTSGIFYGTGGITSTFATGGGFSLDGVHPTARGYAVVANAINTGFAANIPRVDPGAYTTVFYQ